jgi:hypothetical protein
MPTHLYVAEAAAGKTTHVLALAREKARAGRFTPRVVVPTHLQARAVCQVHSCHRERTMAQSAWEQPDSSGP